MMDYFLWAGAICIGYLLIYRAVGGQYGGRWFTAFLMVF